MKQNIRPYLELIGFGKLAQHMPASQFVLASILTDALDQAIDNCHTPAMDEWYNKYSQCHTYSFFRFGIQDLADRTDTLPQEVIALARILITILPTVINNICKYK